MEEDEYKKPQLKRSYATVAPSPSDDDDVIEIDSQRGHVEDWRDSDLDNGEEPHAHHRPKRHQVIEIIDSDPDEDDIDEEDVEDDDATSSEDEAPQRPPQADRIRRWCATVHNNVTVRKGTQAYVSTLRSIHKGLRYVCLQEEIAPTTQKHHFQVYLELKTGVSVRTMITRMYPNHVEAANGSGAENKSYCSKPDTAVPGTFVEWGTMGDENQGKRNDLLDFCNAIMESKDPVRTFREQVTLHPTTFVRNHRGLTILRAMNHAQNVNRQTYNVFVTGLPGSGKTRAITSAYPSAYVKDAGPWWDGYSDQREVIFDEFHTLNIPISSALRWFDRYPTSLQIKGSSAPASFELTFSTSHMDFGPTMRDTYAQQLAFDSKQFDALRRRFQCVLVFTQMYGDDDDEHACGIEMYHVGPRNEGLYSKLTQLDFVHRITTYFCDRLIPISVDGPDGTYAQAQLHDAQVRAQRALRD